MIINEQKIAVFPVDEDFLQLPNNNIIFLNGEKTKISYYLTLAGWNIASPDYTIDVINQFDFNQLDVIVLVNSYRILEHTVVEEIFNIASKNNIEIFCVRDDQDADREAMEKMANKLGVRLSFVCNKVSPDTNTELHSIDVPVISISGVGPYVQKFLAGIKLKNDFEYAGYKTLYISSRKEGILFGSRIFPDFVFEKGIGYSEKIYGLNHYINGLCKEEQPDVILIGVPGEMMELGPRHRLDFGYLASIVFSAIKPDVSVLNLYNLNYTDDFLDEQKHYCKYRFGISPDVFYSSTTGLVESSLQEAWMQFYRTDKICDEHLNSNKLYGMQDVMNGKLYKKIVEILEEYSALEFM